MNWNHLNCVSCSIKHCIKDSTEIEKYFQLYEFGSIQTVKTCEDIFLDTQTVRHFFLIDKIACKLRVVETCEKIRPLFLTSLLFIVSIIINISGIDWKKMRKGWNFSTIQTFVFNTLRHPKLSMGLNAWKTFYETRFDTPI